MVNITSPYEYKEFKRKSVQGKRLYENPYGDPVPSVTTILDKTKPREKVEALNNWKKRVGEEKAKEIVTEAANVGTIMHAILEHYVKNESYETGNNLIHQQAKAMAQEVINNIEPDLNEVWGSEVNLCFPNLYAGTTDLVGVWKGKPTIMDFKQTNKPKKKEWVEDYYLQMAAYAMAHNAVYGTDIREGHVFMCSRAFEYQQFDLVADEFEHWSNEWLKRVEDYYTNHHF